MFFRKFFIFLVGLIIGIAAVSAAGMMYLKVKRAKSGYVRFDAVAPTGSEIGGGARIFVASSLDRIFQDGKTLVKPTFANEIKLSAAGHEYEAFQVVVQAQEASLAGVTLEFSPLVSQSPKVKTSNESSISWHSAPILKYYVVGYVPTEEPYYPTKYVGAWPDPLLPDTGIDIPPGTTQPFWVSVYIPPGGEKGEYRGEIVVKSAGQVLKKIPIQLIVYPFDLPIQSQLKTAFDFYGHITHKRYPMRAKETRETYEARINAINFKFLIMMLQYRMCPILNVDPTDDKQLAMVDRLRILGLNNFSIGKYGGTYNNNWPRADKDIEALTGLYRTYGEMLKLNHILPFTYLYTWDEGTLGNPVVAKICSMVHRAYPGLKNMVCYHGLWDPTEFPDWGKDIDIWCFQIDNFVESKMRALQRMGIEIWMYISGPGGYNSPNLAIDFDSIGYRIVPWLCWKYDIKGFLYWSVNYWELGRDPFVTARNVKWEQNGNGLIFYPGSDGPWPSLRAEIWRDGMEDYEYIQILLKKLMEIKKTKLIETHPEFFEQAKALLMVDKSIAEGIFAYTKDTSVLMARRAAIAEAILKADEMLKNEIQ